MPYALLGEHLSHSLSVPIHEEICHKSGLLFDYHLREIPRERFAADIADILHSYDGVNVTIPYKREIIPFLDDLSPEARAVGAVNTVVREGGHLIGHNTDIAGFVVMLTQAGIPAGVPCWVLGTGGASAAVTYALQQYGCGPIHPVSRDPARGESYAALPEHFSGVLINCTPVGMFPRTEDCPLPQAMLEILLPRATAILDLIYNPVETVLLRNARQRGIPAVNGLTMLHAQAIEAERLWHPGHMIPSFMPSQDSPKHRVTNGDSYDIMHA